MREWDWTIDEYNKHIKEDKGMRGTQIHYEATGDYDVIDIIQDYKLNFNKGKHSQVHSKVRQKG